MPEAYTDIVLDHFRNPRHVGATADADLVGEATNPANAATVRIYLKLDGDRIARATFQSDGCTATIAASSVLTVMLAGATLADADRIDRGRIEEALGGLPPGRRHASRLAEDALRSALKRLSLHAKG